MSKFDEIKEALIEGAAEDVADLVRECLDEGFTATEILNGSLLPAMDEVGEQFKNEEIFLPEVLIAARAMSYGTDVLRPLLVGDAGKKKGVAVTGTVQGDMHDIGKNLVRMLLEGKGITVIDLGADVTPEQFLAAAKENEADLVCMSALLSTTMPEMKKVIDLFTADGYRDKVKIMVGGAPITQEFCDLVGADVFTEDAASAANWADAYLASKN